MPCLDGPADDQHGRGIMRGDGAEICITPYTLAEPSPKPTSYFRDGNGEFVMRDEWMLNELRKGF